MKIDSEKEAMHPKAELLQRGVAAIAKQAQKLLRGDRDEIANTNSQLRFSGCVSCSQFTPTFPANHHISHDLFDKSRNVEQLVPSGIACM